MAHNLIIYEYNSFIQIKTYNISQLIISKLHVFQSSHSEYQKPYSISFVGKELISFNKTLLFEMRSSISYLTCILGKLKEQDVIFCQFEFDPERLAHFKKSFPSASCCVLINAGILLIPLLIVNEWD
ncbi:MAG TPA: hypothetical protein VKZ95_02155 [Sphingobacteriaceae bacterium]|nr:hypothetical protein [Sphingobacteriaceae bacterium]